MRLILAALAAGFALAACGGDGSGPPQEASRLAFTVQPSTAVAGQLISPPIQVALQDASGSVVGGAENAVTLSLVPGPGAALGGTATVTAAAGVATFADLSVSQPGTGYTLNATAAGLPAATSAAFDVTTPASAPATIAPAGGDGQIALVGQAVSVAPSVQVTDGTGLPVGNVSVTFSVGSGGGSGTGLDQVTNASGVATVGQWTLGTTAGANTLLATATGLSGSPVTFTATASPGPPAAISRHGGDGQSAMVDAEVAEAPSVLVADGFGNPVPGVTVTFEVKSGGGDITGSTAATGSDGAATVGSWSLGSSPGPNTLQATSGTLAGSPLTFSATATPVPTSASVEVRNNFYRSARNGSGGNVGIFGEAAVDTIAAGGSVTWEWVGQNHNVTPFEATFTASNTQGAPFTFGPISFNSPGMYTYYCTIHGSVLVPLGLVGMRGRIFVR